MKETLFVILSGMLFTLAYPPFDLHILIFVAFIPLLFVFHRAVNLTQVLLYSLMTCTTLFFFTAILDGYRWEIKLILSIAVFLWGIVYHLLFNLIISHVPWNRYFTSVIVASSWVVLEMLSQKFLNFSWFLYLTQYSQTLLYPIAKAFGIHSISFLVIWVNCMLYQCIQTKKYYSVAAIPITFTVIFVISHFMQPAMPTKDLQVWVVQPNKSIEEMRSVHYGLNEQDYAFYSLFNYDLFRGHKIDFIVWPEGVMERWILRIPDYRKHLVELARKTQAYLVFGCPDLNEDLHEYNGAFLITPEGAIHSYYKKHPVPFTEAHFDVGKNDTLIQTRFGIVDFQICWEALSLQERNQAQITFFLTNDITMGKTYASLAHTRLGVFNALEKDSAFVIAGNTGPSLMVSADGKISSQSLNFTPDILKGTLPIKSTHTTRFILMDYLYFPFFIWGIFKILRGRVKIQFDFRKLAYLPLTAIFICLLLFGNAKIMENISGPFYFKAKIDLDNFMVIPAQTYDYLDSQKQSIQQAFRHYGIHLEKYYSKEQLLQMSSDQILHNLGYELFPLSKLSTHQKIALPILSRTGQNWTIGQVSTAGLSKQNDLSDATTSKINSEEFYVLRPLPY